MPETILREGDGGRFSVTLTIDTDDPLTVHLARMVLAIQDEARQGRLHKRKPTEVLKALDRILLLCDDALDGPGAAERRKHTNEAPNAWIAEAKAARAAAAAGGEGA